jgi:nickel-dependent lactate racemase
VKIVAREPTSVFGNLPLRVPVDIIAQNDKWNDSKLWRTMTYYLNYEGGRIDFTVPTGWNVLSSQDCAEAAVVGDVAKEIERALDDPIGTPPLEKLSQAGMKAVVLFDDMQRATPADFAIPAILNRLNKAGISDGNVTAICARGTHPVLSPEQLKKKVGQEAAERLHGRIHDHDAQSSENVLIGRTRWGTVVEVNKHVAHADLIIGIGTCIPHPYSGYGGGCKIFMPGVCSYRTIGEHHYTWLRNRSCKLSVMDGNSWYEEMAEIARMGGLAFKLDFLLNETDRVIRRASTGCEARHIPLSRFSAKTGRCGNHFGGPTGNRSSGYKGSAQR